MEPIREILHTNLQGLGLDTDDVEYLKTGRHRYVFSYLDPLGFPRYRKITMHTDTWYSRDEGSKTASWLTFLGCDKYWVQNEYGCQIIDTPFIGHDLYELKIGKKFRIPFGEYYTFNGFDLDETLESLGELNRRLLEFQRLTGLVHTDLFSTGRPNNIVWNPYDPSLPKFNVIDCESFQNADQRNLAKFHGRWDTAKAYILSNLVHDGSYS